ncbi:MAG: TonB family protein [Vicinamibacterales bacterium]
MSHRRIVVSTAGVVAVASVSAVAAGIAVPVTLRNPVALSRSEARSSAPSSVQPSRPLAPRIESAVLPASVAIDALPPPETRVIVDARIDESGTVTEATVVQGAPVLAASATNAVEQWRFRPGGPDRATIGFNFASDYSDPGAPAPVRVGGAVAPPSKLRDTRPVYPEKAQQDKVQGVVICETTIGADGKVEYAMVIRSIPALDEAALDAILQWEFTPTLVDGVPHAVVMVITVNFTLAA